MATNLADATAIVRACEEAGVPQYVAVLEELTATLPAASVGVG